MIRKVFFVKKLDIVMTTMVTKQKKVNMIRKCSS